MNKIFIISTVMTSFFAIGLLFLKMEEQNKKHQKIEQVEDTRKIIDCIDCKGSGVVRYDENSDMVKLYLVPVGHQEVCSSCGGNGKLYEMVRPNGMVYYTNIR